MSRRTYVQISLNCSKQVSDEVDRIIGTCLKTKNCFGKKNGFTNEQIINDVLKYLKRIKKILPIHEKDKNFMTVFRERISDRIYFLRTSDASLYQSLAIVSAPMSHERGRIYYIPENYSEYQIAFDTKDADIDAKKQMRDKHDNSVRLLLESKGIVLPMLDTNHSLPQLPSQPEKKSHLPTLDDESKKTAINILKVAPNRTLDTTQWKAETAKKLEKKIHHNAWWKFREEAIKTGLIKDIDPSSIKDEEEKQRLNINRKRKTNIYQYRY